MENNIKVRVLALKNQLLGLSSSKLIEIYKDDNLFLDFLTTLIYMLENENQFLYMSDEFFDNIYSIIGEKRFDFKDKETIDKINNIISKLNHMKQIPEKEKSKELNDYINTQIKKRKINYEINYDDFLDYQLYDFCIYSILSGKMDAELPADSFYSSINYLLEYIPEYFDNKEVLNNSKYILSMIKEAINNSKISKHSKRSEVKIYTKLEKRLNKIELKEE